MYRSFAEFLRSYLQQKLLSEREELVQARGMDYRFLKAANEFLIAEGEAPIPLDKQTHVPADFAKIICHDLGGWQLNAEEHVFNTSGDARDRTRNPERQQRLADLFAACGDYHDEAYPPKEQEPTLKLWKYEQVGGETAALHGMREVGQIDFSKPALLLMNVVYCQHDRPDRLKGGIGRVEKMLEGMRDLNVSDDKKFNIYCLSYPVAGRMHFNADICATNADIHHRYTPHVAEFVRQVLLPSLCIKEDAPKPRQSELHQRLGHFRLYTRSYGSVVGVQIRNAMADIMQHEFGYTAGEIRDAFSQVYCQNMHPVVSISKELPETGSFRSIYVVSKNDLASRSRANYEDFIPEGRAAPTMEKINSHMLLCWRDSPVEGIDYTSYRGSRLARNEAGAIKAPRLLGKPFPKGHDVRLGDHDIAYRDNRGVAGYSSAEPFRRSLQNAMQAEQLPDDLSETFAIKRAYMDEVPYSGFAQSFQSKAEQERALEDIEKMLSGAER